MAARDPVAGGVPSSFSRCAALKPDPSSDLRGGVPVPANQIAAFFRACGGLIELCN